MEPTTCPDWWPLPDGRPIGTRRAPELIAYIRSRSEPVIDIARSYLTMRHPGQEIKVRGTQPALLARQALERHMTGIPVGTVSVGKGTGAHIVRIALDRTGQITANLSKETEPVMRSVSM